MPLWVFDSAFIVGKLYVKIRKHTPVIAVTSVHQVP